jgi:hypothetical protein
LEPELQLDELVLANHLNRAAPSISANIAAGNDRFTFKFEKLEVYQQAVRLTDEFASVTLVAEHGLVVLLPWIA